MLAKLLIAGCVMALCVATHAVGLTAAFGWMSRRRGARGGRGGSGRRGGADRAFGAVRLLSVLAGWIILLHLVEIAFWALLYAWTAAMPDLSSAFYFSCVTYTTTGYGDLVLPGPWRLVGGVEALTGILMCGWSTGFFFAVESRMYPKPPPPPPQHTGLETNTSPAPAPVPVPAPLNASAPASASAIPTRPSP